MIGQELIDRVRSTTENPSPGRFTDDQILALLNEGYTDWCRYTEMLHKSSTFALPQYNSLVSVPSDYVSMRQVRWSYNRELYIRTERELDYRETGWPFQVGTPESVVFYNYNVLRTKPIATAAGTVTFRYTYAPTDFTLTTEPAIPKIYHIWLAEFACAQSYYLWRDYENGAAAMGRYMEARKKARGQAQEKTPDTLTSQRPVTAFNYNRWDYGYRSR